jgi:hypothetical protein
MPQQANVRSGSMRPFNGRDFDQLAGLLIVGVRSCDALTPVHAAVSARGHERQWRISHWYEKLSTRVVFEGMWRTVAVAA